MVYYFAAPKRTYKLKINTGALGVCSALSCDGIIVDLGRYFETTDESLYDAFAVMVDDYLMLDPNGLPDSVVNAFIRISEYR